MNQEHPNHSVIAVTVKNDTVFIQKQEILYCESHAGITHIHLAGTEQKKILLNKPLKTISDSLDTDSFSLIHQSYLVNLKHLIKLTTSKKVSVVMSNGAVLPVARARKEAFLSLFKRL